MKKFLIPAILLISISIGVMLYLEKSNPSEYAAEQIQDAIKRNVPIIDIRRFDEWKRYGTIKGSHKLTFFDGKGRYNINKWMFDFTQIITDKNQEFILVCAHANRTKVVINFLQKEGYINAHDLKGGINYGWIDKGLPTVQY
jgi:rhodanese-related sulfurtransferase